MNDIPELYKATFAKHEGVIKKAHEIIKKSLGKDLKFVVDFDSLKVNPEFANTGFQHFTKIAYNICHAFKFTADKIKSDLGKKQDLPLRKEWYTKALEILEVKIGGEDVFPKKVKEDPNKNSYDGTTKTFTTQYNAFLFPHEVSAAKAGVGLNVLVDDLKDGSMPCSVQLNIIQAEAKLLTKHLDTLKKCSGIVFKWNCDYDALWKNDKIRMSWKKNEKIAAGKLCTNVMSYLGHIANGMNTAIKKDKLKILKGHFEKYCTKKEIMFQSKDMKEVVECQIVDGVIVMTASEKDFCQNAGNISTRLLFDLNGKDFGDGLPYGVVENIQTIEKKELKKNLDMVKRATGKPYKFVCDYLALWKNENISIHRKWIDKTQKGKLGNQAIMGYLVHVAKQLVSSKAKEKELVEKFVKATDKKEIVFTTGDFKEYVKVEIKEGKCFIIAGEKEFEKNNHHTSGELVKAMKAL